MKKIIFPVLFLFSVAVSAQEVTPKSVIEKYITAIGGQTAVAGIKDFYMEVEGSVQGQDMSMVVQKKLPNKLFTSVNVSGMGEVQKMVFDGIKGLSSSMGNEQVLEGEATKQLEAQSSIIGEIEYLKDLEKLTFEGTEVIDGQNCNVLTIQNAVGEAKEYYSIASGLKIRQINEMETPMGATTITIDYKDYKKVGDIMFPHTLKQDMGVMAMELTVKTIKMNQNLADSIFEVK
jgi:zinc protease